eukprot:CCRYP_009629-RA/>CCRYP_009629-RA protein AED:0.05 eAED:0.05 QI:131/1/1/1/1/1/4/641/590
MSLGRGAGINKPAWMARNERDGPNPSSERHREDRSRSRSRSRGREERDQFGRAKGREDRRRDDDYDRYDDRRDRGGRRHRDRDDGRRRRGGGSGANRSGIYFHSWEEERAWLESRRRKRLSRPSPFDVPPTPEQLAEEEARAAFGSLVGGTLHSSNPTSVQPQQTRHARRLYVGNIPDVSEAEVHDFFRNAIRDSIILDPRREVCASHKSQYVDNDPIISVYINRERRFAFLEFKTMEITSALLEFDGVDVLGRGKVKIKRPNDFNPALAPILSMETMPMFDTSKLGIVSQTVQDGPNKIFIGGLPYHLVESQVLELLSAFGAVKAFHLVKNDPTAVTSKGYCFVEYVDPNVTQIAAMGLNGMDMGGGKVLTAKVADPQGGGGGIDAGGSVPMAAPTNVVDGVDVDALLNAAIGGAGTVAPMPDMMMQQQFQQPLLAAGLVNATSQQPQVVVTDPLAVANAAASALDAAFGGGAAPAQPVAQALTNSSPTRILVLLNMVADDDLKTDEDRKFLEEDVSEEAGKYGRLLSMKIPRHEDGYAPSAVKKIFCEFATVADAINAEKELKGRVFGSNVVGASYFSEENYAKNLLS